MEKYIVKNIELLYNVLSFVIDDHPELDNKIKLLVELLYRKDSKIIKQNQDFLYKILKKIQKLQDVQDTLTDNEFYDLIYKEIIKK